MAYSNDDVAAMILEWAKRQDERDAMEYARINGTVEGGPEGDGRYPVPVGPGQTALVACPARVAFESKRMEVLRLVVGSGSLTLSPEEHHGALLSIVGATASSNVTVRIPEGITPGFHCMFAAEGSGKIIFDMDGEGFVRQDQGFDRTRAAYSVAGLISRSRDSQGRSTVYLYGSLAGA